MCTLTLKISHRPNGKEADMLDPTHACTTANASVNYSRCVQQRPYPFPIAPMGKLRPDGRLTICSLFAGRRCLCQWWHSVNRELPDLLQHSYLCARCFSKFPIAPMGKLLTCLPGLSLPQLRPMLRSTTGLCTCRRDSRFPIAPMGDSRFAPCLQGGGVYVDGGTVSIVNSQIYSNIAADVRARVRNFPSPRWDFHMFGAFACRAAVFSSVEAR